MKETIRTTALTLVISLVFGIALYATLTIADPTGPNSANVVSSERASINNNASQVDAQAGNITALNIDGTSITKAWQGYYGNITGDITLEDASGDVFYNWSGLGSLSGEVYASRNDSITWSGIGCINTTEIANENSYLGKSGGEPDTVEGTFNDTNHSAFSVGTTDISADSCRSANAFTSTGEDANRFHQVLLSDTSSNTVYTTLIDADQSAFDSSTADFELLVGENGNETNQGSTPYFFYIELS